MGTGHGARALPANDTGRWVEAHEALTRLARQRAVLDAEEGRSLLRALRSAAHVFLGYGSFVHYVERLFGYKPRTTHEKLRVAAALEALPRLAGALESGALSWCAARELTRVAVAETESAWLDAARGKTQRELEALVASARPGDCPGTAGDPSPRSHVLRFEVAADTFATFREALRRLERTAGGRLDDDALLLAMARQVLGGPHDPGRSSYQISLDLCSACGRGTQRAGGECVPVDAAVVAMTLCDAQHLGERLPPEPPAVAPSTVAEPRAAASPANENAARGPGRGASEPMAAKGAAAPRCPDHAHVGAETPRHHGPAAAPPNGAARVTPRPRARQNIPPALRRAVLARDRHCRVPGCRHATFLDIHHILPLSEGGGNELANLLGICSAHHRATHRGELLIERNGDGALAFHHADGSPYGDATAPQAIDAFAKVFSALRRLGFREAEVKAVLTVLGSDATLASAPVERLLREALCRFGPRAR